MLIWQCITKLQPDWKNITILNTTKGIQTRKNEQQKDIGKTKLLQELRGVFLPAFCPMPDQSHNTEQQSPRPNRGSAAVYGWWIQQQPIYIHLSRNMQVEANIMVMFICFWLQNVCKCICKLSSPIRLMAKWQISPYYYKVWGGWQRDTVIASEARQSL